MKDAEASPRSKRARVDRDVAKALSKARSLEEVLRIVKAEEERFSNDASAVLALLGRLPILLAAEVLPPGTTVDGMAKRLQAGESLQTAALPSRPGGGGGPLEANLQAFVWAQQGIEALLRDGGIDDWSMRLEILAAVGAFLGKVRLEPGMSRSLVDVAANELSHWLKQNRQDMDAHSLRQACRFARGVACSAVLAEPTSGAFVQHVVVAALVKTLVLATKAIQVPAATLHDGALALALSRPWPLDSISAKIAGNLQKVLPKVVAVALQGDPVEAAGGSLDVVAAAASSAGLKGGASKENQDSCFASSADHSVIGCVIDGHGAQGAAASSAICSFLQAHLPRIPDGQRTGRLLKELLALADVSVLTGEVDTRLCGATCAVVRIEAGAASPQSLRRISVAHVGDCRVILGRKKGDDWKVVRLTKDHVVTDPGEALRIVATGGCLRCAKPKNGFGATDAVGVGQPRLWSRLVSGAPGLAVSRGLGDALAKSCGLSAEVDVLEATLSEEDLVVVAGSDGVFDVLQDHEVLQRCLPRRRAKDAQGAASAVVSAASKAWARQTGGSYCDDVSCVVFFL
eukprot:TRINITY_DN92268_c0_g1_i1.p1 TRINITY_DN92268_c0_g1~~TRINITY_DN92268_c0_g1_i1.p1  ORF type:complete len:573 (+),score=125.29 TRINITY_DN92268_c0_g1_i1:124-1842(+)